MSGLAAFLWDLAKVGGAGFVAVGAGGSGGAGWVDAFVQRTTKPVPGSNVGAGVYQNRPSPTEDAVTATGVSYNSTNREYTVTAGVTVEDRVFYGFVNLGNGSVLLNCRIAGPPAEIANTRAIVQGPSTSGQGRIEFCTIDPTVASAHYDGIGRGVYAKRSWITNVVDGIRGFSTSASGARIYAEGCVFDRAVQFSPDYVNTRAETHNDVGVQLQGNPSGTNDDIVLDGCAVNARHSLTKGDVPPYRAQIAAIMFTPQTSVGAAHAKVVYCWLEGGVFCVNAGSDATLMASSSLEVSYCRFERPGTDAYGDGRAPDVALAVDSSLPFTGVGNTYIDNGANVPVTNA